MPTPKPEDPRPELCDDPLLREAPIIAGFKVLDPAVLYKKLGAGGMGAVYRGRHFKLDLDVAVKVLKPSLIADDPGFVKRFDREAHLAASISHQNVVRVMDVHQNHGLHYLVMEFVRGETAAERVRRFGQLDERVALAILVGACAGLAEAHAHHVVHRDIKPDNILIAHDGRVKVADLGLAKSRNHVDGRSMSMDVSRVMGTAQFMAPEQWDTMDVTAAADVWALGATFYSLVTGRAGAGTGSTYTIAKRIKEADYPSLRDARPDLRPEVHAMFERCVQREPAQRFFDAGHLLRELRRLASEDEWVLSSAPTGGLPPPDPVAPPPRETIRRIRAEIETKAIAKRAEPQPAGESEPASPPDSPSDSEKPTVPQVLAPGARPQPEPAGKPRRTRKRQRPARSKRPTREPDENLLAGVAPVVPVVEATTPLQVAATVPQPPATPAKSSWAAWFTAALVVAAVLAGGYADGWFTTANGNGTEGLKPNEPGSRLKIGVADTTPPVIEWVAPEPGKPVNPGEVEVRGTVTDANSVKSVTVNGQLAALDGTRWKAKVKVEAAKPGARGMPVVRVSVVATDQFGNVSKAIERLLPVVPPVARRLETGIGLTMVRIEAATFRMGSPASEPGRQADETQHAVTISKPYWIGETEVTQKQWRAVMGTEPWKGGEYRFGDDVAATCVSWNDAVAFCQKLTEQERAAGRLPAGHRYGLPSEAQWELAARGSKDNTTAYCFGNDVSKLREYAVFSEVFAVSGLVRGNRKANAFGLYDMHGGAAEWCADCASYENNAVVTDCYRDGVTDPIGVTGSGRVVRGGCTDDEAAYCRSAFRGHRDSSFAIHLIGFRAALLPGPPGK